MSLNDDDHAHSERRITQPYVASSVSSVRKAQSVTANYREEEM